MPASTNTEDISSHNMSNETLRRKHHVLHGERQAILARQNKKFEANIARNVATLTEDPKISVSVWFRNLKSALLVR